MKKLDFKDENIYIGIDVHQKTWYVTILIGEVIKKQVFDPVPKLLSEYMNKNYPNANYFAAYEAGCFGFWIKKELDKLGISTIVINPADLPTSDKDKKTKNDARDSKTIAKALKSGLIKGIYVPDNKTLELRALVRCRASKVTNQTRIKNQIKSRLKMFGIQIPKEFTDNKNQWSKSFIEWLQSIKFETSEGNILMEIELEELLFVKTQIKKIEKQIKKFINGVDYLEGYNTLTQVPGIGFVSAVTILLEVDDIKRFKRRDEFISFIGLSPNEHSSGESRKIGHMTRRCNKYLRTIFIEAAWVAVRQDPALTMYYNDQVKRIGKVKSIIKVARKLASKVRTIIMNKQEYVYGLVG
jgi:Transposase and inactivated derivatives